MSQQQQDRDREISALMGALAHYSTRASARRRLLEIGAPAVGALIEALQSPVDGVAWSAAVTLGQIGAAEAVGALEKALSRPAVVDAAREAITRITGRERPATRSAPFAPGGPREDRAARLDDDQLAEALRSDTVSVEKGRAGFTINVLLPGGRRQGVQMLSLKDSDGMALVAFYTECGPADSSKFARALKANLKIPFGAFAVRETPGGDQFVMVDAYLREGATVDQLRKALQSIARRGDAFERELTGADER